MTELDDQARMVSEADYYHRLQMAEEARHDATRLAGFVILYRAVTFVFQMSEPNDRRQDALQEAIERSGIVRVRGPLGAQPEGVRR